MIELNSQRIVISRTDSIGDVMLSLPLCAWLKTHYPGTTIIFLGRTYTRAVVEAFASVDEFVDWAELENAPKAIQRQKMMDLRADIILHVFPRREIAQLAKGVKIPVRVGTSHRNFHLLNCNHRVNFTRKRSELHEAQLNFHLLRPFGLKELPEWDELLKYTEFFRPKLIDLPGELNDLSNSVILHPKSQGSAVEWPVSSYKELAQLLVEKGFTPVFTGTENEGSQFLGEIEDLHGVVDASGKLSLDQLIVLISKCKGFVACSTGPLHIAGFLDVPTVGLYAPRRPIHPGRWRPIGKKARALVFDEGCSKCREGKACDCITRIDTTQVLNALRNE